MMALTPNICRCWPTRSMVKILSPILNCSSLPMETGKMSREQEMLLFPKSPTTESLNVTHSQLQGILFPSQEVEV